MRREGDDVLKELLRWQLPKPTAPRDFRFAMGCEYVDEVFWNRVLYDRLPLVVKLSDRITVEPLKMQVPPTIDLDEDMIGVGVVGTNASR